MYVLGVVGGMGPLAAHAFFGALLQETPATRDQDHLHVIIDSDPRIPDRTRFILGNGEDPRPRIRDSARRLATAGAQKLVMPCNTAGAFLEDLREASGLEVVDWVAITIDAITRSGARKVGLLATTGTVTSRLYEKPLLESGVGVVRPGRAEQARLMDIIYGIGGAKSGAISDMRRTELVELAHGLHDRGADLMLLGCTELPLVVGADSPAWPSPAIDPARVVARAIAQAAGAAGEPATSESTSR